MRIDSHQHFWSFDVAQYGWIDDSMSLLRRSFLPEELKPLLDRQGLDGCVAVQARESFAETDFLLNLAGSNNWVKMVVGWLDLCSDQLPAELERLGEVSTLAGFRQVLQSISPDLMDDRRFRAGLGQLHAHDFSFDLLIYPDHLPAATRLVRDFPKQRFVIDHLAKPRIRQSEILEWTQKIRAIAQYDNVYCKLSGMVTEADWTNWTPAQMFPYLDVAFEAFGSQRLMYGSDWPVALLAGSYQQVHGLLQNYLEALSETEKQQVMGGTACEFYGIKH